MLKNMGCIVKYNEWFWLCKINNLFLISYDFFVHNPIMLLYNEVENRISVYLRGRVKIPTGGDELYVILF